MATGMRYSYTDSNINKRAISDAVFMIDWLEAPLLRLIGFGEDGVQKFRVAQWPATKVEIIEDTMSPFVSALDATGFADGSGTTVGVTAGTGSFFRDGDVINIYDAAGEVVAEQVLVTGVSTDTLTVVRGYGSYSGAARAGLLPIGIATRVMPEGADYTTGHTTTTTQPYNWVQIISEAAKVTKTEMKVLKWGIEDAMDYHVAKLFANGSSSGKLAQLLQRTFYWGERVARDASNRGSMGGFKTFVSTALSGANMVIDKAGATVERKDIHQIIRGARDNGGRITHITAGSWFCEVVTAMYEDLIRTTNDDKRGGSAITMVRTPHGEVELVYDWMSPPHEAYFWNMDKVAWLPLRQFEQNEIKEQGDYFVSDVVGEFTFMVANAESHGYITNMANE